MKFVTAPSFSKFPFLVHGMFTRLGGASKAPYAESNFRLDSNDDPAAVRETYRRAGECLGFWVEHLVAGKQVHEDTVRVIRKEDAGLLWRARPACDAFVTNVPKIPLGVYGADCQPILLVDPHQRVIGAAHAGWRGTAKGIAGKTVRTMCTEYGCDAGEIRVFIAPHIHSCCYEVSEEVADALGAEKIIRGGSVYIELSNCVSRDLEAVGVRPEHIAVSDICTRCHSDLFWSHRAVAGGERGVCLAVIMLKEEEE